MGATLGSVTFPPQASGEHPWVWGGPASVLRFSLLSLLHPVLACPHGTKDLSGLCLKIRGAWGEGWHCQVPTWCSIHPISEALEFFELLWGQRTKCSPGYLAWRDSSSELMKSPHYTSVFRLKVPCGHAFISRLTFIRQINTKGKLETDKRNLCNLGQYWLSLTCYFKTIWELDSFLEYISKILSTVFLRPVA